MNERTTRPGWTPRRLLSLLMALIMTLSLLPTAVFADDGDTPEAGEGSGGSGTTCTITFDKGDYSEATIPELGPGIAVWVENDGYSYTIPDRAVATLDGYTFIGWQIKDATDNVVYKVKNTIKSITDNLTLIPVFEKNYTITFESLLSGASGMLSSATSTGKTYTVLYTPKMNGYTFTGWQVTSGNAEVNGQNISNITSDITLTAQWTEDTGTSRHAVTFYSVGSTVWSTMYVNDGEYVQRPNDPTREDYKFEGWYTDNDGNTPFNFGTPITENTSVYAHWTSEQVTVTFTAIAEDAGVSYATGTPASQKVNKGTDVSFRLKLEKGYDPATLHVYAGDVELAASACKTDSNDYTIYEYTIRGVQKNTEVTVAAPSLTKYTVTLPMSDKVEVKFTNPESTRKSTTVDYNGEVTFTVTARTGYTVKGVYVNDVKVEPKTGAADTYELFNITENKTVTVDVAAIVFHKVTYIINDHTYVVQEVQDGQTSTVNDPIVEGYHFDGWFTSQTGGTQVTLTNITTDMIVYAHLTANTYKVTYNPNGGAFAADVTTTQPKTHGQALTLNGPIPTRDGYTFLGWSALKTATSASYVNGDQYSNEGDVTLYAVWKVNTYTVTLPTGTGYSISYTGSTTVEYNDGFTFTVTVDRAYAQKTPTVTVNNGTKQEALTADTSVPNSDGSITYTYTIKNIMENKVVSVSVKQNLMLTVTFEAPVGTFYISQQVEEGSVVTRPTDPVVEGYEFKGWYKNETNGNGSGAAWNFDTDTVTERTTIYAKLDPITPKITWPDSSKQIGYTMAVTDKGVDGTASKELASGDTVAYGSEVTFTIKISEGYDASKMQVGINGTLLSPSEINGNVYTFKFIAKEDTNITVVGVERKTITITYNDNGGYGGPVQQTVNYYLAGDANNGTISNVVPKREGYEFLGWAVMNNAADPAYSNPKTDKTSDVADFTTDTVLYAVWKTKQTDVTLAVDTDAQYEGENVTLTATVTSGTSSVTTGSVKFYRCTDADPTAEDAKWTLIDSKTVSGGTAVLTVATSGYLREGPNKDTYKAVFIPTEGAGYVNVTSTTVSVAVKSTAISWKLNGDAIGTDANKLTIKQNNTPVEKMSAGQVYTLELPAIYALDEQGENTKLAVNKDYEVTWQYCNDKGEWVDYPNAGSGDTVTVDAAYSQYVFRAVVTPVTGATSHFTKAAKFNDVESKLVANQYETKLITAQTATVQLQATTTALEITGAKNEGTVKIAGRDVTTGLAQFEGQKVTLTATVTDTSTNAGVKSGNVKFYRYVDGTKDELLNTTLIAVDSNGVATCEVEITAWNAGKTVAENKDQFYAVYEANATYDTSASYVPATAGADAAGALQTVYIKSTTIKTPIIESTVANKDGEKATTYTKDLTGLLAGVEHTFTLRTGNDKADWSVVALDGRTVDSSNYDIEWQVKTDDNFTTVGNDATAVKYVTSTTKTGDQYRVLLKAKNDMKVNAVSQIVEIGTKQTVTVTVTASDEIESTPATDVYQLNNITLTATVEAAGQSPTMKPAGTVTFYYKDGNSWVKLDSKTLAEDSNHNMTASITTNKLPVDAEKNTQREIEITAVYEGNETFEASAKAVAANEKYTIEAVESCDTTNKTVTVYSSVVYVTDAVENKTVTVTDKTHNSGIYIYDENDKVLANEENVNLKLSEVYTLDHDIALSKLTYGKDYTVQWQKLLNAASYPDKASADTPWLSITSATGTTCQINVEQGAAYRAVITVANPATAVVKGSFLEVDQGIVGQKDIKDGRQVYYSNILVAANAPATLTVNVNTSNTSKGYEGIVEGETVTIHTFTSGATGTTPISELTVEVFAGKTIESDATPVFKETRTDVNGHVSFDWSNGVTPGYYTLKVKATFTNGYDDKEITRTLIVRDNDYEFELTGDNAVYNGRVQGLNVAVQNMGIENELAQKSVVVYYYTDEARTQQVEATQAGTYYVTVRLQESAYWTEKTIPTTFTIKPREVSVVDLIAQAKVYDGTTNANIQEIILNDATVDSTTGLPNGSSGIIDGDSVYAGGTGYTSQATVGTTATLGVKDVTLKGDDAANYDLVKPDYTEPFNIQRSQVKGAIVSSRIYKYTGKDIKLSASDIYLIDQAGNELTNYDVTYYYHNGDGVEKVDAMNKMGKYTVIAGPKQDNYKGGATATVYVGTADAAGTLVKNAVSSLITISNTVELYGATENKGIVASATSSAAATVEYQNGTGWSETLPTAAGRYLVKVTSSTGDTAYGIYTVVKARPEFIPTTNEPGVEYSSGQYSGTVGAGFVDGKSDSTAETYITYTGGTIQGVAYEAPTEVGKYIATVHVGETANYTAHEEQVAFEITPKALTITADSISRQQYGAYPDLTASFSGLATDGVAADTSLRDVQIQPELIDKSNYSNDASDQVGNVYKITAVAALARNYEVSYVDGNMSVTPEDPKLYLEIRGMIENGNGATNLAYYGDVIQLYAYGNQSKAGVYNTSSVLTWDVTGLATITQDGLLTVTGVGNVTVTLTRGIGAQKISTTLTFTAMAKEVSIDVPDVDKVYNASKQTYDGAVTVSGLINGDTDAAALVGGSERTNVGSQITSYKVDTNKYISETYGGLFTINDLDVTIKPTAKSTIYGTQVTDLNYTEVMPAGSDKVLTDDNAVSVADIYGNLDVYDGYEILVAGKENPNYNVHYQTKNDKETVGDVQVTAKPLTVSTGTLDEQTGMTSGSLNPAGKYPVDGAEVKSDSMGKSNVRMYGEPNWVMDYELTELISGDSLADLATLPTWLVKFDYSKLHDIAEDANVKYDAKNSFLSGKNAYSVDSSIAFGNYSVSKDNGTQNIYQRPVELKLRDGMTQLNAYKPTIMPNGSVDKTALKELIINNLVVTKHNDEGGLAELLKHTIKDLDIQISYSISGDTITVTVTIGNQNYYLANAPVTVTVKVDQTKIVAKYGPLGWTSASVTMIGVDENGNETGPVNIVGDKVRYEIYVKDSSITNPKYSDYKDKTPVRKVNMTKGSSTGVYIANYDRLPAGEYVMFAIAEGYTIIE